MAKSKFQPLPDEIPESPESLLFENLVPQLSEDKLEELYSKVYQAYEDDESSLESLMDQRKEWNKKFDLHMEEKNYPWKGASNIKMPVITTAVINGASRLNGNLVDSRNIVNGLPLGKEIADAEKAARVARHMNYQLKFSMEEFLDSMRVTCTQLFRDGSAFRKTFFDSLKNRIVSDYLKPENFVVNYYTKRLEDATRTSEKIYMTVNDIRIRQKQGVYNESEVAPATTPEKTDYEEYKDEMNNLEVNVDDETTPRLIIEQHTYLDLDDTGIEYPYIVTFDYDSQTIYRIIKREHPITGREMEYYTAYNLLPNDSSIYGYGFGRLLLPINDAMDKAINQFIDAAHANNVKTGFISRKAGLKRGNIQLQMGKLMEVDIRQTDDIRKTVTEWGFSPPSGALITLVEFLNGFSQRLTTVTEIFTGDAPKSDTTATSSAIAVEQGAKLFTDIQRSAHISFKKELKKIFLLNSIFLDEEQYFAINVNTEDPQSIEMSQIMKDDYDPNLVDIMPVSDPNIVSKQEIIQKAMFLQQTVAQDPILQGSPAAWQVARTEVLKAMEYSENIIQQFNQSAQMQLQQMIEQAKQEGFQAGLAQGQEQGASQVAGQVQQQQQINQAINDEVSRRTGGQ